MPEIASIFGIPFFVVKEMDMFLPPMSNRPTDKMAPIFAIIYTWVFPNTYCMFFLNYSSLGYELLVET